MFQQLNVVPWSICALAAKAERIYLLATSHKVRPWQNPHDIYFSIPRSLLLFQYFKKSIYLSKQCNILKEFFEFVKSTLFENNLNFAPYQHSEVLSYSWRIGPSEVWKETLTNFLHRQHTGLVYRLELTLFLLKNTWGIRLTREFVEVSMCFARSLSICKRYNVLDPSMKGGNFFSVILGF